MKNLCLRNIKIQKHNHEMRLLEQYKLGLMMETKLLSILPILSFKIEVNWKKK